MGPHERRVGLAEAFAREARRRFPGRILDVRLFGSVARGEDGPDSDIDVFILWDGPRDEGRRLLVGLACDLLLQFGDYVSVKVMAPEEIAAARDHGNQFVETVLADGRALA